MQPPTRAARRNRETAATRLNIGLSAKATASAPVICDRLFRKARACSGSGTATSPAALRLPLQPFQCRRATAVEATAFEKAVSMVRLRISAFGFPCGETRGGKVEQLGPAFAGDPDAVEGEFRQGAILLRGADFRGQIVKPVTHLAPRLRAADQLQEGLAIQGLEGVPVFLGRPFPGEPAQAAHPAQTAQRYRDRRRRRGHERIHTLRNSFRS